MFVHKQLLFFVALITATAVGATPSWGQMLTGAPTHPQCKYSTPMPPGVAEPDKIETRLGTLKFFDGFPEKATAEKLFNNLDFQRAVQAYLLAIPAVSQAANRNATRTLRPLNTVVPIYEQLQDARSIILTANDNTVYTWTWIDLSKGPIVLETPPKVLGTVNDMWQRWVVDVGVTGPDKGRGGKYLFLPPGYKGSAPKGYHVVRFSYFQSVDTVAQLPRQWRPEARCRPGEEVHKNLSAIQRREDSTAAQLR